MIMLAQGEWVALAFNVFRIVIRRRDGKDVHGTAYYPGPAVKGHPEAVLAGTIKGCMPAEGCAHECPYCRGSLVKHGFKVLRYESADPEGYAAQCADPKGNPAKNADPRAAMGKARRGPFEKHVILLQIMICKNPMCRSHFREADPGLPHPIHAQGRGGDSHARVLPWRWRGDPGR